MHRGGMHPAVDYAIAETNDPHAHVEVCEASERVPTAPCREESQGHANVVPKELNQPWTEADMQEQGGVRSHAIDGKEVSESNAP